jgi:hypothetical protein
MKTRENMRISTFFRKALTSFRDLEEIIHVFSRTMM